MKSLGPAALNGSKKAPFPGFADPCLALLVEKAPVGDKWLHEIKFDGYRLTAAIQKSKARLLTRRGHDWTARFPAIAQGLDLLPVDSAVLDGEAVIEDESGISSFSALQEALSDQKPAENAVIYAHYSILRVASLTAM